MKRFIWLILTIALVQLLSVKSATIPCPPASFNSCTGDCAPLEDENGCPACICGADLLARCPDEEKNCDADCSQVIADDGCTICVCDKPDK